MLFRWTLMLLFLQACVPRNLPFGGFDRQGYNAQMVRRRQVQSVPIRPRPVFVGGVDRTDMVYQARKLRDQELQKYALGKFFQPRSPSNPLSRG